MIPIKFCARQKKIKKNKEQKKKNKKIKKTKTKTNKKTYERMLTVSLVFAYNFCNLYTEIINK
jgi:hypothetical protein